MDMAPEASDGVQVKEVEMVPAGTDPQQQQQQQRVVAAHQDYFEEEDEAAAAVAEAELKEVNELLPLRARLLRQLRARISEALEHAGPHRAAFTGDVGGRCLAFIETELSIIAALTTPVSQQQRAALLRVHDLANSVLREFDPSRYRLQLRRASRCFLRHRDPYLLACTVQLYYINEHPSRYRHLLNLGLKPQPPEPPEPGALPLFGIDRLTKKMFWWLALAHQGKTMDMNMRVMSIVGPVGIGKTTLAMELRNRLRQHQTSSSRGRYYFQCNVMAQASRGTDRSIRLLQDILSQVSPAATAGSSDEPSLEFLVELVSTNLLDKRYFLIIDDLWEASDWEKIKGAFPSNDLGSRIVVTTRSTSTAWACSFSDSYDGLVHEMKPLSEIDSERLLLAKAVGSVDGCLPNNMKVRCDEILGRCDGIPFFIIGMAEWLKEQRLQQQQHNPLKDRQRFAPEWLEQALSSAFNDFRDDDLRLLLFYMSMLPYGHKFEKDRLILKWIHEGLIDHADGQGSKLEAETLFSRLVDRNVITCIESDSKLKQDEGRACQWKVNPLMQQFLAAKSAKMGFIFTTTTLNMIAAATTHRRNRRNSRMPRRLALHHRGPQHLSLLEKIDLSQTRSLSVSGTVSGIPLDKFPNVVVLDLEGWENLKDEDLLLVCRNKMFFLRYLSVRNTRIHKLPREIKELRMLRTLDLSYTQISELPLELFELNLSYLYLRGTPISQLSKQIVDLPIVDGIGGDLTEHPASFFRVLGDMLTMRVLELSWSFHHSTDKECCEALLSSIKKWRSLESLSIHCGLGCSMEFLGSLEKSHAPPGLEKFKVTAGRFASVPQWICGHEYLAFVQITVCNKQTTTDDLKILEALPKLKCLILGFDFIPGQAIVIGNEGFYELQRFSVECPMPWLSFSTGAMRGLTYLQLKFCSTPASQTFCVPSGISNLSRLTEVALCYNAQYINNPSIKMTVEAVTQQVAKHRNPIDLIINGIEQDDVQEAGDEVTEITIGTSSSTNAGAEDDAQAVGEEATAEIECEITEAES